MGRIKEQMINAMNAEQYAEQQRRQHEEREHLEWIEWRDRQIPLIKEKIAVASEYRAARYRAILWQLENDIVPDRRDMDFLTYGVETGPAPMGADNKRIR